jgi:hypothetical protein
MLPRRTTRHREAVAHALPGLRPAGLPPGSSRAATTPVASRRSVMTPDRVSFTTPAPPPRWPTMRHRPAATSSPPTAMTIPRSPTRMCSRGFAQTRRARLEARHGPPASRRPRPRAGRAASAGTTTTGQAPSGTSCPTSSTGRSCPPTSRWPPRPGPRSRPRPRKPLRHLARPSRSRLRQGRPRRGQPPRRQGVRQPTPRRSRSRTGNRSHPDGGRGLGSAQKYSRSAAARGPVPRRLPLRRPSSPRCHARPGHAKPGGARLGRGGHSRPVSPAWPCSAAARALPRAADPERPHAMTMTP